MSAGRTDDVTATRPARVGAAHLVLAAALLLGVCGPWLTPHDPLAIPRDAALHSRFPSAAHWLGTDPLGRDVASRVLAGTRTTLGVATLALGVSTALGLLVGAVAALLPRRGERVVLRLIDTMASLPRLVLLLAAVGIAGAQRAWVLALLLAAISWIDLARLVHRHLRAQLVADHVLAARALGVRPWRLVRAHLLPSARGVLLVWASGEFGQLVLAETGLSFMGLGVPAPTPSWGRVLLETGDVFGESRWLVLGPGLLITMTVAAAFSVADRAAATDR